MYMSLKVEEEGTVHFLKSEGAGLRPGDLIATMNLDSPDAVVKAEVLAIKYSHQLWLFSWGSAFDVCL